MNKILIISPDRIAKTMAGPGIRYWNFAIELAMVCDITLIVKNDDFPEHSQFEILLKEQVKEKSFYEKFDAIIIQGLTLWEMPFLKDLNVPLVIDLYDPIILENLEHSTEDEVSVLIAKSNLEILLQQIHYGDYFICASNKQKDFWLGMLAASFRINPKTYHDDKSLRNLIGVVPFGLPSRNPVKRIQAIKGVIDGISETDKVVLWWGGVWDWLDPITLIKAMSLVVRERLDIKCLIIGTRHPDPSFIPHKIVKEVIGLSNKLGLTNKVVFFIDWVNYEERMDYLLESDLGVSLHYDNLETRFAFRTRILDYLWCRLPMVVTEGDTLAEIVKQYNLGEVIKPKDSEALAKSILQLHDKKSDDNFSSVVPNYYWDRVIKDLRDFCLKPRKSGDHAIMMKFKPKTISRYRLYFIKGIRLIREGSYTNLLKKIFSKIKN